VVGADAPPVPQGDPAVPEVLPPWRCAMSARESLMPVCAICGERRGPWRPSGERYPSGAQVLVCSTPCSPQPELTAEQLAEVEAARAAGANWLEAPLPEDGAL
jgi:hypothetical protein